MDRRRFVLTSLATMLAAALAAGAQQAGKVYRVGSLREGADAYLLLLAESMRGLGWVEGQNLEIEQRTAHKQDELPGLAAELVRLKVDLIFTVGTVATQAAKEATKTIPIVFNVGDDPVVSGLVGSFARPGENLTGFAVGQYDEKLLDTLKEAHPSVSRVAFPAPSDPGPPAAQRSFVSLVARLTTAARVLGVEIQRIQVRGPHDFDLFFAAAKRHGANAVLVPNIVWFRPHLDSIGAAAARSRLPAIGYDRQFAASGGLLAYGPVPLQNVPRVAAQIDRILKGASPGDLPVEEPTKFELIVNLRTAKTLGLTVPPSLLLRADQVIE